jgi:transcriptional regulator with XRE-family HTH domain
LTASQLKTPTLLFYQYAHIRHDMTITAAQCRAARALLDIRQPQLAASAGVSPTTIRDLESGKRTPIANNLAAIRAALEQAGVEFIAENGGGAGVRLRNLTGSAGTI